MSKLGMIYSGVNSLGSAEIRVLTRPTDSIASLLEQYQKRGYVLTTEPGPLGYTPGPRPVAMSIAGVARPLRNFELGELVTWQTKGGATRAGRIVAYHGKHDYIVEATDGVLAKRARSGGVEWYQIPFYRIGAEGGQK